MNEINVNVFGPFSKDDMKFLKRMEFCIGHQPSLSMSYERWKQYKSIHIYHTKWGHGLCMMPVTSTGSYFHGKYHTATDLTVEQLREVLL